MKYKPMSLDGGLDQYSWKEERINNKDCRGRKVYFTTEGGYSLENEIANKKFSLNQELTVKEIYVGRSSSNVEFDEVEGRWNTVMFSDSKVCE